MKKNRLTVLLFSLVFTLLCSSCGVNKNENTLIESQTPIHSNKSVTVPNLNNVDEASAKQVLLSIGLIPVVEYENNSIVRAGNVIRTNPEACLEVEKETRVTMYVSLGVSENLETPDPTEASVETDKPSTVTATPSAEPDTTQIPQATETQKPTEKPTPLVTATPTIMPTATPTAKPTESPTLEPTAAVDEVIEADIIIRDGNIYLRYKDLSVNSFLEMFSEEIEIEKKLCELAGKEFDINVSANSNILGMEWNTPTDYASPLEIFISIDSSDNRYKLIKEYYQEDMLGNTLISIRFGGQTANALFMVLSEKNYSPYFERFDRSFSGSICCYLPDEMKIE